MTEQYIYWSDEEAALLAEQYPAVGLDGCSKLLPHRTKRSIRYKVAALGLKKDFAKSDRARFFSKVEKRDTGCWEWVGQINKHGYGVFSVLAKPITAHRFSYSLHHGKDPADLLVCHTCDNPKCVNPEHLFLGTVLDNHRDMDRKGRRRNQYGAPRATHQ